MRRLAAAGAGMVFVVAAGGRADQVTLYPSRDTTLYFSATGALADGAGQDFFTGMTGQPAERRGLLRFDLSPIPAGSTVTSVTLTLYLSTAAGDSGVRMAGLRRVTSDWGEGASVALGEEGGGAAPATGDATWLHTFFSGQFWTTPGGDFAGTDSASAGVDDVAGHDVTWGPSPGMVLDVQSWLSSPSANFGWLVLGDETVPGTARRFNSRENLDAATRPRLVVTFTPPCYANCDASTTPPVLNVADFTCFLQKFASGAAYANCDASTTAPVLNVADFTCFLQKYAAGCS